MTTETKPVTTAPVAQSTAPSTTPENKGEGVKGDSKTDKITKVTWTNWLFPTEKQEGITRLFWNIVGTAWYIFPMGPLNIAKWSLDVVLSIFSSTPKSDTEDSDETKNEKETTEAEKEKETNEAEKEKETTDAEKKKETTDGVNSQPSAPVAEHKGIVHRSVDYVADTAKAHPRVATSVATVLSVIGVYGLWT